MSALTNTINRTRSKANWDTFYNWLDAWVWGTKTEVRSHYGDLIKKREPQAPSKCVSRFMLVSLVLAALVVGICAGGNWLVLNKPIIFAFAGAFVVLCWIVWTVRD